MMIVSLKTLRFSIILLVLTLVINANGSAQCKSELKEALKKLEPYMHNGQINNMTITNGKPVELHLSFYKGLRYKLQIASEATLGEIQFKIFDEQKNEIFNNSEGKEDYWDFLSTSSQELTIELFSTDKTKKGCMTVLVGMKSNKVASNPIRDL